MSNIEAYGIEALTGAYVKLRDQRSELKRDFDTADFSLKEKMQKIEFAMMKKLTDFNIDSAKTPHGTVYTQVEQKFSCGDWTNFWQYCADTGRLDYLEKRVSQSAMKGLLENSEELPPGIQYSAEKVVRVRRS